MISIKELAKWIKKSVQFLKENPDYVGTWKELNRIYSLVVLWEEGWGEEKRDDVIQSSVDPNWGLCVGIKIYDEEKPLDLWLYPWDEETADLITESTGITPKEDYEQLAAWVLRDFEEIKDLTPREDGSISDYDVPAEGIAAVITPDEDVKEIELEEPVENTEEPVEEGILNKNAKKYSFEELSQLEQNLYDFLSEKDIYPDDLGLSQSSSPLGDLSLSIIVRGDWKHDHLYTEHLVQKWCDENNLVIGKHTSEQIGESESDWYEAEHKWELLVNSEKGDGKETVAGFQKMFAPVENDEE